MPDEPRAHPVTFHYRPALDGLRALAVCGVLLFHGGVAWLPGGFLGVDAFFVLSGFLITSLLLAEQANDGHIRLGAFWLRRARRLLPALLLVVAVVVATFRVLLPPEEIALLRGDALASLGYIANWRMIYRGGDYFAATATPSPLQHAWSLGIEEQFYVVWPLLLVAYLWIRRRWTPRVGEGLAALAAVCGVGAVASAVAAALVFRPDDVNRAYYGTDTRAQALLIGCGLAAALLRWRPAAATARAFSLAGAAGFLGAGWLWLHADGSDGWLFHGGLSVDAVAAAAVIALVTVRPAGLLSRALSVLPLVWLGRLSYGVYLWHWPIFRLLTADRTGLVGTRLLLLRIVTTLGIATASYLLIEAPIRAGRLPWRRTTPATARRRPVVAATIAAASVVGVGAFAVVGTPPRAPMSAAPAFAISPAGGPAGATAQPTPSATVRPGRRPGAMPRLAFLGDSVAWTLGTYLPPHPGIAVTVRAIQGCGIARLPDLRQLGSGGTNYPGCTSWDGRWRRSIQADDPDVAVILLDRWELMDRMLDGRYQHVGEPGYDHYLSGELDLAIHIAGSRGAQVVLLTAPYTHRSERPDGGLYDEDQPARVDAWNRLLRSAAAQDPRHVRVLDLNARVCPNHRFTWSIGGLQIRSDGLHFTPDGVRQWIAPWLVPQLAAIAVAPSPESTGATSPISHAAPTPR